MQENNIILTDVEAEYWVDCTIETEWYTIETVRAGNLLFVEEE